MFNLETAIQTWLHSLGLEHTLDAADVEELEDHLRHHVDKLISGGASPENAFRTASSDHPGSNRNSSRTVVEDTSGEMKVNFSKLYFVDDDFLDTYDLEIVAGRNFSSEFPSDSTSAMLINEQAARSFAFNDPRDAIGKRYLQWGKEGVTVGVFKDFNFMSLHSHIRALSMRFAQANGLFFKLVSI